MEKIKLYDGTELEIVDVSEGEGILYLTFKNVNLDEIRAALNEPNNLSFIQVLTEGGAFCRGFEGYGTVEEYTTVESITGENSITVKITKKNILMQKIEELEEKNRFLEGCILEMSEIVYSEKGEL